MSVKGARSSRDDCYRVGTQEGRSLAPLLSWDMEGRMDPFDRHRLGDRAVSLDQTGFFFRNGEFKTHSGTS